jgi:hypothetical protein
MNYNEIMLSIMTGEQDEWLDNIAALVHNRKREMAPKIWEFQVGDIVKFNDNTNPKYLRGQNATVRKINRTKIVVDLDCRQGRFFKNITVPLTLVDKV